MAVMVHFRSVTGFSRFRDRNILFDVGNWVGHLLWISHGIANHLPGPFLLGVTFTIHSYSPPAVGNSDVD